MQLRPLSLSSLALKQLPLSVIVDLCSISSQICKVPSDYIDILYVSTLYRSPTESYLLLELLNKLCMSLSFAQGWYRGEIGRRTEYDCNVSAAVRGARCAIERAKISIAFIRLIRISSVLSVGPTRPKVEIYIDAR